MKEFEYLLFRAAVWIAKNLSDRNLFRISSFFKWIVYRVIAYRKDVVLKNLKASFPARSNAELNIISSQYYQNLCDIIFETFASYHWSVDKMKEHFIFINPDLLKEEKYKETTFIGISGHIGNFELGAVLVPFHLGIASFAVYRPLANKKINDYILEQRNRTGLKFLNSLHLRSLLQDMPSPSILFLLADQNPTNIEKAFWVNFLQQDTAFVHGPATLSKELNAPIVFFDTQRVSRGIYQTELSILIEEPSSLTAEEITQIIAKKLEQNIIQRPDDWLWSHKRWKWQRVNNIPVRV
ncbi:MAG: lysophospholipid acyltransferase family protein [Saprospiraceae bacterium]